MRLRPSIVVLAVALVLIAPAAEIRAQDATEKELEKYRQMLKDDPRPHRVPHPFAHDAVQDFQLMPTPAARLVR